MRKSRPFVPHRRIHPGYKRVYHLLPRQDRTGRKAGIRVPRFLSMCWSQSQTRTCRSAIWTHRSHRIRRICCCERPIRIRIVSTVLGLSRRCDGSVNPPVPTGYRRSIEDPMTPEYMSTSVCRYQTSTDHSTRTFRCTHRTGTSDYRRRSQHHCFLDNRAFRC